MTGPSDRSDRVHAAVEHLPPPPRESLKKKAIYWQYRAVWELAARMPDPIARGMPRRLGRLWHRLASERQLSMVERNLARVAGHPPSEELQELVEQAYVSYARYWLDAFRLHTMDIGEVLASSSEENTDVLDDIRDSGDGGILATAHLGSWDVGALFSANRGWDMTVVAEVLEPRRLFERFVELRRNAGIGVIPLVKGGNMVDQLVDVVEKGGIATLLADRDLTKKGPIVDFFGEPCRLPPGTAVLARRTGRPVVTGAWVTEGHGYRAVVVGDPVDISHLSVEDGTQVVAHELEKLIGRFPEQWHVFVPNWLADREPDHPALS